MAEKMEKEVLITAAGVLLYIGGIGLKIKYHLWGNIEFWYFFAAYLLIGYSVFKKIADHFSKKIILDGNLLMVIATAGALGIGCYAEAVTVILIFQVGNYLELFVNSRTKKKIRNLLDVHAVYATKLEDGEEINIEPSELEVGDIIVVRPGEWIPVDGVIVSGTTSLNTQVITGESMPSEEETGSKVYSGSMNMTGAIEVRVIHTYDDSTASRILTLVESGEETRTEKEKKTTRAVGIYTFLVLAAAAAMAVVLKFFGNDVGYNEALQKSFTFLVAACPCAVTMSVTSAFLGGICSAAKRGIVVKGGQYLEILSRVNTFLFDKTGTLTEGVFEVQEVEAFGRTEEELLEIATYIESYSNHPIALSLKNAYGKELDQDRMTEMEEIPGYGLTATYEGKRVYLGNARLMKSKAITFQEIRKAGSVIYIAVEGKYAGYIVISDKIKKDVKEMLRYLKKHCHAVFAMVTGDTQFTGESVAGILGLDYYYANQLPEDKVERLKEFMEMQDETECLAVVGDGINDAPILAKADVGIAMGAYGSDAAIEAADIVLMEDECLAVVDAVRIARETMKVIRQNTLFAVLVKIVVVVLTVFGIFSMREAITAEVCVIVISIMNAVWASKDPA